MLQKLFRPLVCRVILLYDWCTRPSPIRRSEQEQMLLARETRGLALYARTDCPHSIRVRRCLHQWNVPLELRDIRKSQVYHDDLLAGAGRISTPCLKVEEGGQVRWIVEAEEILAYLDARFSPAGQRRTA